MPTDKPFLFLDVDKWIGNGKLNAASWSDAGAWLEIMCHLHKEAEYGVIRVPLNRLSRMTGVPMSLLNSLIKQCIMKGAPEGGTSEPEYHDDKYGRHLILDAQPGPIWFSSKMIYDRWWRERAASFGRSGGNPTLKGGLKGGLNLNPIQSNPKLAAAAGEAEEKLRQAGCPPDLAARAASAVSLVDVEQWLAAAAAIPRINNHGLWASTCILRGDPLPPEHQAKLRADAGKAKRRDVADARSVEAAAKVERDFESIPRQKRDEIYSETNQNDDVLKRKYTTYSRWVRERAERAASNAGPNPF